jgi:hypothetical protein
MCGSFLFRNSFALTNSAPLCGLGHISGGCRLGCALGLRKRQQICRSSGSSIGSCGIGCCGGSGSVGAAVAGCTLRVGAAGRGLVGAGGVLRLCPCGLHYALAAQALPLRLVLHPHGSRYALAAHALPSWLALRARGLDFALAAWLCPCNSRYVLAAWAAEAAAVAAAAVEAAVVNACPRGLRYALAGLGFALAAQLRPLCPRGSALPKHNNQTAKQQPQKLLRQRCRQSATAVAAGGSSAGSCGGISCGSIGGSISISGNGGGGGGGSSGGRRQQQQK